MQRGLWVMSGCLVGVLGSAASAQAPSTDPGMTLALREAKNGEIAFGGPVDHLSHRFTIVAQTADPVALIDVRVPDFTDGTGKQIPIRWSWTGAPPRTIDVRRPGEILVECALPAPAIYSTVIEILYAFRDATGKDLIKPLRVPLRFERTAAVPSTSPPELPITALAADTFEATMFWSSTTAEVELALRGTGATVSRVDKAIPVAVPRKGAGSQLIQSGATATVKDGIPADVPRDEVHRRACEVSRPPRPSFELVHQDPSCRTCSHSSTTGSPGEHGIFASEIEVEWGTVDHGAMRRMPAHGGLLGLCDRLYVRIMNKAQRPLYAHIFNIGLRGRITLLTSAAPSGVQLTSNGQEFVLGQAFDGRLTGLKLSWPDGLPRDTFPRSDEIVVIITEAPASLLAQKPACDRDPTSGRHGHDERSRRRPAAGRPDLHALPE